MTIGPMLTMAMMSMSMGYTSLTGMLMEQLRNFNGNANIEFMSGAMLATMLLWPTIQRNLSKKVTRGKRNREKKLNIPEYLNSKKRKKFNQE